MILNEIIRILGETINHTNSKLLNNIYYLLIKISRLWHKTKKENR